MTKISKSSTNMLILALALSGSVVASFFITRSTGASSVRAVEPMSSVKPVSGIDVIVRCLQCKPPITARSQTDANGSFTVGDLTLGTYEASLVCNARCQGMNDLSAGVIQFTLTGAKESPFKRNISKQQLVAGANFSVEVVGRKSEPKTLNGIVSLVK
jgi:hypothetical protein